jgi:uncharacterized protein YjbI with pentapeptide repeats
VQANLTCVAHPRYNGNPPQREASGANLKRVCLDRANLVAADLCGANRGDASLSYANLEKAKVDPEQLAGVASLEGATMPDGTVHD